MGECCMVQISEERLRKLERLEKLLGNKKVKIVIEDDRLETKPGQRQESRSKQQDRKPPLRHKRFIFNDTPDATVLTPALLIGVITGLLTGVPVIGLLFIILLPLFGFMLMKLFPILLNMRAGIHKGALATLCAGVIAVFVSIVLLFVLEIFFASMVYDVAYSYLSFLDPSIINTLLGITGIDKTLSFNGLFARFFITIVIYPILFLLGAYVYTKFAR